MPGRQGATKRTRAGEFCGRDQHGRRSQNDVEVVAVPENTIDFAGLNPGIGSTGDPVVQIVSPIRASLVSLIPEIMYPTWPALPKQRKGVRGHEMGRG